MRLRFWRKPKQVKLRKRYDRDAISLDDVELYYINPGKRNQTGVRFTSDYWDRQHAWQFFDRIQIVILKLLIKRGRYVNSRQR